MPVSSICLFLGDVAASIRYIKFPIVKIGHIKQLYSVSSVLIVAHAGAFLKPDNIGKANLIAKALAEHLHKSRFDEVV